MTQKQNSIAKKLKAMNVEKELKSYEKSAYNLPKKHGQTCFGYGILAAAATIVFLICAGALLGFAQQRKIFNSGLQETTCFVDSLMYQSSSIVFAVHYQTIDQIMVYSTKTLQYPRHDFSSIPESFPCYYKKTEVFKLDDLENENAVFIPSMICFALSVVPIITIVAYYFIYWKKLVASEQN